MVSHSEPASGTNTLSINVGLTSASGKTITVDYATMDGTATSPADFTATSGTLTFAPGDGIKSVDIEVQGDGSSEGNETLTLMISNPSNASLGTSSCAITLKDPSSSLATVVTWGTNESGDCANGNTDFVNFPVPASSSIYGAIDMQASTSRSYFALMPDGTVWSWGLNQYGSLGDPNMQPFSSRNTPQAIAGLSNITSIYVTGLTTFALDQSGTLWGWGYGQNGKLGNGGFTDSSTPAMVSISNVTSVCKGSVSTVLALKNDGTVWAWGMGMYGGMGNGLTVDKVATPQQVPNLSNVRSVFSDSTNCFAVANNGSVWCWGRNQYGYLGTGDTSMQLTPFQHPTLSGVLEITGYSGTYFARLLNGEFMGWGENFVSTLGLGHSNTVPNPISLPALSGFQSVLILHGNVIAIDSTDQVWVWGDNRGIPLLDIGSLGLGHENRVPTPTKLGGLHAKVVFQNAWGGGAVVAP